jgi:hypothetical protein
MERVSVQERGYRSAAQKESTAGVQRALLPQMQEFPCILLGSSYLLFGIWSAIYVVNHLVFIVTVLGVLPLYLAKVL